MSDPLKTSDIEDVLSSIRRLVSEEARPKHATAAAPDTDKLVLTPALRVQEQDTDNTPPQPADEGQDAAQADAPLVLGADLQGDAPLPEHDAEDLEIPSPDPATLEWEDHDPEHSDAELPEASTDSHAPQKAEPADAAGPDAAQDWSGTLYEAAGVTSEQAPDAPEIAPAQPSEEDANFDFLAEDDGLIDEEALRELVSEIVRQELQGALGERITRNVRKLVRREIHRALSAQEFD